MADRAVETMPATAALNVGGVVICPWTSITFLPSNISSPFLLCDWLVRLAPLMVLAFYRSNIGAANSSSISGTRVARCCSYRYRGSASSDTRFGSMP